MPAPDPSTATAPATSGSPAVSLTPQAPLADPTAHEATLDPESWDEIRALGHRMIDDMVDMLRTVRERPAWRSTPHDVRARFSTALPQDPAPPAEVYREFRELVQPYPTGNIHPRFWGWVMGTGTATGVLAELLTASLNANAFGGDQAATWLELQVLDWVKAMLGYPAAATGVLVSGGSMANLVGLTAARNAKAAIAPAEHGLVAADRPSTLYCSAETHSSVAKAAALLGFGRLDVRTIPVRDDYAVDVAALDAAIRADRAAGAHPFCIVANAGTVNTGAFDDLPALADIAEREAMWLHVDGAFGALAAISDRTRHLVRGLERADSIGIDLHKWMQMQYEVGCALVRDGSAHRGAFAHAASYLDPQGRGLAAGSQWFSEYGLQLSRGNRALKVWMELKTHGLSRYAALVEQNVDQARYLAGLIDRAPQLALAAPVPLNIVCFRIDAPALSGEARGALTKELLLRLQERGIAVPSSTMLDGEYAIRVAISNHRSTRADFELLVEAAAGMAGELIAGAGG